MERKRQFWHTFLQALETEPRDAQSVRGASGFVHPILAVGVDEARRRTVVVSAEPDARTAALAQADIQVALPSTKVAMARPVAINLQSVAEFCNDAVGSLRFPMSRFDALKEGAPGRSEMEKIIGRFVNEIVERGALPFKHVELHTVTVWKELVQQLSLLQLEGFDESEVDSSGSKKPAAVIFEQLMSYDPVAIDRMGGVCAVPLYDLQESDSEILTSGNVEAARALLRENDVLQYFFPAADQIALAVIDKGKGTPTNVMQHVLLAPETGHPLAPNELVDPNVRVTELVEALTTKGLLVEGTAAFEVSSTGSAVRAEVKFKPREGVMEKLARVLSVKVDVSLKDWFK